MIDQLEFHVIGVNHRTAGVEVRERFALSATALSDLLRQRAAVQQSALFLSTCNRSEFYWAGTEDHQDWFTEFARARGVTDPSAIVRYDGLAAVRHLFMVAAGLDSQILGETEILGQVRRAYDAARGAGTTTSDMDAVFSAALIAGRRVRRETMLGRHPASVSSAAVDVVAERMGTLEDRHAVVIGAGEAAEGALRALHERGVGRWTLVNRGPERAKALAEAWGASVAAWDDLPHVLKSADVVFVATGAKHPVITADQLRAARGDSSDRRITVVDLSVPRNVEPSASLLEHITLLDLDDLQRLRCPITGDALPALREAERVLDDELARLNARLRGRVEGTKLADLHRLGDEIVERETAWALAQLDGLSEDEQAVIRQMADRLVRRVLYPVSRAVRSDDF